MNFCPNCENLIIPKKENGKTILECDKCGFFQDLLEHEGLVITDKKIDKEIKGEGVSSGENALATFHHTCKRCGHDKVQVLDMGVFISDEDNLILLKCGKCGFTERVGRRTS